MKSVCEMAFAFVTKKINAKCAYSVYENSREFVVIGLALVLKCERSGISDDKLLKFRSFVYKHGRATLFRLNLTHCV